MAPKKGWAMAREKHLCYNILYMEGWYTLLAFVLGFLVAQLWKLVAGLLSGHRTHEVVNLKTAIGYFSRSGGMPSGHTASFTAASVYLGLVSGFGSGLFALAACTWMIVVYDAIHVRYAVGEQGKALNELLEKAGRPKVPLVEGHTMSQAVVGAVIGVLIAVGMFVLTRKAL